VTISSPVFCAVDTPNIDKAVALAAQLRGHVHGLKLGMEFFLAHGIAGYNRIAETGVPIFLDLKLHDIPNTVAGGITSLLTLKPNFMTIHTSGGHAMMKAAADAAAKAGSARPKILGVTVLTSMDASDLSAVGQDNSTTQQVVRLAKLAKESGLDGVICSPEEIAPIRAALGKDFILMVPGIRPVWAAANDQKRIMTPHEAITAGATYLVIGRPITGAEIPADAAQRINAEITAEITRV
jgi:orotidine-5'-phosphate decarboxylase